MYETILTKQGHLSHVMRKPVLAICEQQRTRSACASAQSDQHLCCSLLSTYNAYTCEIQTFKPLASLCSWAGRFESYLVRNPEDRFSRDVAHLIMTVRKVYVELDSQKSNTVRLYCHWNRIMFYFATNHWAELRDANYRILWHHPSHCLCFLDVRRCNVVFAHTEHKKYNVKFCVQSKVFVGFSVHNVYVGIVRRQHQ